MARSVQSLIDTLEYRIDYANRVIDKYPDAYEQRLPNGQKNFVAPSAGKRANDLSVMIDKKSGEAFLVPCDGHILSAMVHVPVENKFNCDIWNVFHAFKEKYPKSWERLVKVAVEQCGKKTDY